MKKIIYEMIFGGLILTGILVSGYSILKQEEKFRVYEKNRLVVKQIAETIKMYKSEADIVDGLANKQIELLSTELKFEIQDNTNGKK